MNHKSLCNDYQIIATKYSNQIEGKAKTILSRGLVVCNNDKVKSPRLVLSGINPSYNPNHPEVMPFDFVTANGYYWRIKHKQFGGSDSLLVRDHIAYLDLFPIRERYQSVFEREFLSYNEFRFKMVSHTADAIEQLQPKLIVHANKSSLYYWGLNPNTFETDKVNPWLGYQFSPIDDKCPILKSYYKRVSEFVDENGKSIPKEKRYVHLFRISGRGFKQPVYFLTYVMEYYGMKPWQKFQLLSPTEMNNLWEWCRIN